ncbi:hypothetical protein FACS1894176_06730 [Bacteroidia bacterium]|nr:hypothetical protein FACS1894176_06730 [Bacteroidia bacterium]
MEDSLKKLKQPAPESTAFSDNLIYVPMNPIVKEAQDLGGAEAVAFGYNVVGTAFINLFTQNTLALSLAGPLIEKLGFFLWELIKAIKHHKKTGKSIGKEFKANISNGIKNLLVDITIHDTIYAVLMAYGISHQLFEPRILAIFSFILALPPAIFVKYSGNELLYYLRKQITKWYGFKREKYYEARFIVDSYPNPAELFQQTAKKF